jgi:hypothetical protein
MQSVYFVIDIFQMRITKFLENFILLPDFVKICLLKKLGNQTFKMHCLRP